MGYAIVQARDVQAGTAAITGLPNGAEVVGWAYGAEPGDVSNPFQIDGNYIIACLVEHQGRGCASFRKCGGRHACWCPQGQEG